MKKAELKQINAQLRAKIDGYESADEKIRESLSVFLGSYRRDMYSRENEVKVLSWPEIYFELGKLKGDFDEMNEVFAMRNEHKRIYRLIEDLNKKVFGEQKEAS